MLLTRCHPLQSGPRTGASRVATELQHLLTQTLLPELSTRILERMARGEGFRKVHISVDEYGEFV